MISSSNQLINSGSLVPVFGPNGARAPKRKHFTSGTAELNSDKRIRAVSSVVPSNRSDVGWVGRSLFQLRQVFSNISTSNTEMPQNFSLIVLSDQMMVSVAGITHAISSNFNRGSQFINSLMSQYVLCETSRNILDQLPNLKQAAPSFSNEYIKKLEKRIREIVTNIEFQRNPTIEQVRRLLLQQSQETEGLSISAQEFIGKYLDRQNRMIQE